MAPKDRRLRIPSNLFTMSKSKDVKQQQRKPPAGKKSADNESPCPGFYVSHGRLSNHYWLNEEVYSPGGHKATFPALPGLEIGARKGVFSTPVIGLSGAGGEADLNHSPAKGPLLATSGSHAQPTFFRVPDQRQRFRRQPSAGDTRRNTSKPTRHHSFLINIGPAWAIGRQGFVNTVETADSRW